MRSGGSSLHELLEKVLNVGVADGMDTEKIRVVKSANVLHLLSIGLSIFLFCEGLDAGAPSFMVIAALTLCASVGGLYFSYCKSFSYWPSIVLTIWLNGLFLYATAVGSGARSSYIWLFVFPFLGMLTFGLRKGTILLATQAMCLACIFFLPGDPLLRADYSEALRESVFAAYIFACCAAFGGELIRWQALKKITELMRRLETISVTDELTEVLNRRAFNSFLEEELARFSRAGRGFCLVLCDLDHFKRINDTYGHAGGDEALRIFAGLLRSHSRKQDIAARWGGEEFILLLPDTGLDGGVRMAEKLRSRLAGTPMPHAWGGFTMTMSAGVYAAVAGDKAEECVRRVDAVLYRAKREGRNKVCF